MYDAFWTFYQEYDARYQQQGDPGQQSLDCDGATFELRISMGIPRARMKLPRQIDPKAPATEAAIQAFAGRNGFVGGTAYTASKHAVLGFSRSLMLEVRKDNVRVAAICPDSVATGLFDDQSMLKPDAARILRPEDVAQSILHVVELPERALVSELDLRPTNP